MKKKLGLICLCGIILLSVCGCNNNEENVKNSVVGNYKYINNILELYDDGSCYYEETMDMGENVDCTYKVNGNIIRVQYTWQEIVGDGEKTYNKEFTILEDGNLQTENWNGMDTYKKE